jgi:hypothetical protein
MASRQRRQQPQPGPNVWKIRLPADIAERVKSKAAALGAPQNRVIINELAAFPGLDQQRRLGELIGHVEVVLARYGARISGLDLTENLLSAVDAVLKAETSDALQGAVERLRVERLGLLALGEQASRKPKTGA